MAVSSLGLVLVESREDSSLQLEGDVIYGKLRLIILLVSHCNSPNILVETQILNVSCDGEELFFIYGLFIGVIPTLHTITLPLPRF
jgi:hypothetical protein